MQQSMSIQKYESRVNQYIHRASTKQSSQGVNYLYGALGGLAGLMTDSLLHPLDTVRTRIKTNIRESVTIGSQVRRIRIHEGSNAFFRGYSCTLGGSYISNGTYFFVYENLKNTLQRRHDVHKDVAPFIAAFAGGLAANFVYLPFIVIRTRMQLAPGKYDYNNLYDGVKKVCRREGFKKLYLGGPAFLTQTALETSLTFGFYEIFRQIYKPFFGPKHDTNIGLSVLSSISAASLVAVMINPLDVVVARTQTQKHNIGHQSITSIAKMIYMKEGLGGFMKGVRGTISQYSMQALILLPSYEILKNFYKEELGESM